jgi:hypothetical protein
VPLFALIGKSAHAIAISAPKYFTGSRRHARALCQPYPIADTGLGRTAINALLVLLGGP